MKKNHNHLRDGPNYAALNCALTSQVWKAVDARKEHGKDSDEYRHEHEKVEKLKERLRGR